MQKSKSSFSLFSLVSHVSKEAGMRRKRVSHCFRTLLLVCSVFTRVPLLIFENLRGAATHPLLDLYLLLCALWAANIFSTLSYCSIKVTLVWFIAAIWEFQHNLLSLFSTRFMCYLCPVALKRLSLLLVGFHLFTAGNFCHTWAPMGS